MTARTPSVPDPIRRPARAQPTSAIALSGSARITGSDWPTRDRSVPPTLDTTVAV